MNKILEILTLILICLIYIKEESFLIIGGLGINDTTNSKYCQYNLLNIFML